MIYHVEALHTEMKNRQLKSGEFSIYKYDRPQDGMQFFRVTLYDPIIQFDDPDLSVAIGNAVEHVKKNYALKNPADKP